MSLYANLRLEHQLCFALYAATNAITRTYRGKLSRIGLTYPQYLVMMVLWEQDALSVKDVARRLQLDSATITPLLKRLESSGFIKRTRSESDERVVQVTLTEDGREIQAQVAKMQSEVECQTQLEYAEFVELRSQLHRLADTLLRSQPEDAQSAA
ncbi:MAG TPA: MarR family transcriptional regulator [Methylophilaceae bacterium]|nr:MarR family transcriptional regulator [Methylophilaceae bacterium]